MNYDTLTTTLGGVIAAAVGSTIDPARLGEGDKNEIAKAIVTIFTAILGFFINRKKKPAVGTKLDIAGNEVLIPFGTACGALHPGTSEPCFLVPGHLGNHAAGTVEDPKRW